MKGVWWVLWVMQGWGGCCGMSCRGGVCHVGVGWGQSCRGGMGVVGHAGVGWGEVCHAGVGCVMQG